MQLYKYVSIYIYTFVNPYIYNSMFLFLGCLKIRLLFDLFTPHNKMKFVSYKICLDEYWQNHPELHDIPIYYASSLAKKCMAVYQTYVNAMNDKIRKQININNPFVFKHISNLKVSAGEGPSIIGESAALTAAGAQSFLLRSRCFSSRPRFSAGRQQFSNWHFFLLQQFLPLAQNLHTFSVFTLLIKLGLSAIETGSPDEENILHYILSFSILCSN